MCGEGGLSLGLNFDGGKVLRIENTCSRSGGTQTDDHEREPGGEKVSDGSREKRNGSPGKEGGLPRPRQGANESRDFRGIYSVEKEKTDSHQ